MENISEIVSKEVQKFKNQSTILTEGYAFSQYQTIRQINLYLAGKFWECSDPNALFWNLGLNRVQLYAKSIDMDSKDFYVFGIGKTNWFQAWILNARFKRWVRESRFSLTLDDVSVDIAKYGSSVWKKVEQEDGTVLIEKADLRNLYFDPTVKNIINSPVTELHYMTETEIRTKWPEKADEIIDNADEARDGEDNEAETEDETYEIWERWGEYKGENDDKDAKYMHYVGSGEGEHEVILVEEEIKTKNGKPTEFPYFDFHGERIQGRWLGLGVIERLFTLQEQINRLVNQNDEANQIASLLLFRTADPNINGNILQAATSGQIINSIDMQQLPVDNRFIGTFINQLQTIENKANELCFINESISGETPPSGVPFRSLAVSTRAAQSTFKFIKTSIGEKMGYILQEQIMPSLVKKFNKEDVIDIAEDEIDIRIYDERMADNAVEQYKKERAKAGLVVFVQDIEEVRARAKKDVERNRRIEKIGKGFFDFEYGIMMNPTGESLDKNTINSAIDGALQTLISAPAIANNPLFKQKLEINNIPAFRLTQEEIAELQETRQAGKQLPEAPAEDKLAQLAEG